MVRTALCELLGIDLPILNVGFGDGAPAELAAAVSNAGGCGVVGSAALSASAVRAQVARTRALTDRPFGVNVILAGLAYDGWSSLVVEHLDVCLDEAVPVLVLFWGDAAAFVEPAHRVGTKVLLQVGSVDEARAAAACGVDGIIAQGVQAGGHVRGRTSIWELLPDCVAAVAPVPVLASGGIGDGASIARALSLGAQGVSLGTTFLAAEEADIHPTYRQRVLGAIASDTVLTDDLFDVGFPDAPHRTLRSTTFEQWDRAGRPASGQRPDEQIPIGRLGAPTHAEVARYAPFMATSTFDGDVEAAPLWAGESVDSVNVPQPAATIVERLARETDAALASD